MYHKIIDLSRRLNYFVGDCFVVPPSAGLLACLPAGNDDHPYAEIMAMNGIIGTRNLSPTTHMAPPMETAIK